MDPAAGRGSGTPWSGVYLYIPTRGRELDSPLRYNHPVTLDEVLWLVSGVQFRAQFGFLSVSGAFAFLGSLDALWQLLVEPGHAGRPHRGPRRPRRSWSGDGRRSA